MPPQTHYSEDQDDWQPRISHYHVERLRMTRREVGLRGALVRWQGHPKPWDHLGVSRSTWKRRERDFRLWIIDRDLHWDDVVASICADDMTAYNLFHQWYQFGVSRPRMGRPKGS